MVIEESVVIHATVDKVWMIFTDLICFHGFEKAVMVTSKETFSGLLTKGSGFLLPLKKMRSLQEFF